MLKPLTFSLSLALALGFCSVSMAGGHDDNCTTCGLASAQGGPYATGQGVAGCDPAPCAPKKHCFSFHLPKIHCNFPKLVHTCSYEWVLKKKHNFCLKKEPKCNDGGCARPVACILRARVLQLPQDSTLLPQASTVHLRVRPTAPASMPSRLRSPQRRSPRPPPR